MYQYVASKENNVYSVYAEVNPFVIMNMRTESAAQLHTFLPLRTRTMFYKPVSSNPMHLSTCSNMWWACFEWLVAFCRSSLWTIGGLRMIQTSVWTMVCLFLHACILLKLHYLPVMSWCVPHLATSPSTSIRTFVNALIYEVCGPAATPSRQPCNLKHVLLVEERKWQMYSLERLCDHKDICYYLMSIRLLDSNLQSFRRTLQNSLPLLCTCIIVSSVVLLCGVSSHVQWKPLKSLWYMRACT